MNANLISIALAAGLACGAAAAQTTITPGGSASLALPGTTSIYQVFGHDGSTAGAATDAPYVSFAAGSGRVFTFTSVTGGVNCCGNPGELYAPDGKGLGSLGPQDSAVGGMNGLSDVSGNTQLPLLAVFTSETDPFGSAAPAALAAWDAAKPTSLAPALRQVFYVGDGRAGFNDAAGVLLTFTAPATATRLYLGFVDAGGFNGMSGYYSDNPGSMTATVALAVPEPGSAALLLGGLAALGAVARRRQR